MTLDSPFKALAMVVFGLALGMVGTDVNTGQFRFTFGLFELADGFSIVALAMGLFGVAEILANIGQPSGVMQDVGRIRFRDMLPTRKQWKTIAWPTLRGSGIGSFVGALPGTGPGIASLMAYAVEKRISKRPETFGKGALEGISAPEAANNASVQAAFIPTLSLGIPGDAVVAVLMGAMILHGITPGPNLINEQPQMFWGLIMSFWVGNLLLLVLNIPLIGMWVKLLSVPYRMLYPCVLIFICLGVYSANNNVFDIFVVLGFGILGYLMRRTGFPATPGSAGLHPGAAAGRELPPRHAAVARRPWRVLHQPDQRGVHGAEPAVPGVGVPAGPARPVAGEGTAWESVRTRRNTVVRSTTIPRTARRSVTS